MATVRMKKGEKFADIYDSPETIAQARSEGYEPVAKTEKVVTTDSDEEKEANVKQGKKPARQ